MRKRSAFLAAVIAVFLSAAFGCKKKEEKAGQSPAAQRQAAREKIQKLPEPDQWERAWKEGTIASYEAYLAYYPEGPNSARAKSALIGLWDKKVKELSMEDMKNLIAVLKTNYGTIKFKFFPEDAPETCRNFIKLAMSHFYDGLIFHRVVPGFVIQGGDPLGTGMGGPGYHIKAEFNSRKHLEGTVAMARARDPDSAGSQFYICLAPQPALDGKYTVFGQVVEGLDVLHAIERVPRMRERPIRAAVDAQGRVLNIPLDDEGNPKEPLPPGAKVMDIPRMEKVYIEGL